MKEKPLHTSNTAATKSPTSGRRAILPYNGALTHENCSELRLDVLTEIKRKRSEVILDFKHVVLLDSATLEVLVELHETLQAQGRRLKIIRIQKMCMDILIATRILHSLKTYEDLHAAITNTP